MPPSSDPFPWLDGTCAASIGATTSCGGPQVGVVDEPGRLDAHRERSERQGDGGTGHVHDAVLLRQPRSRPQVDGIIDRPLVERDDLQRRVRPGLRSGVVRQLEVDAAPRAAQPCRDAAVLERVGWTRVERAEIGAHADVVVSAAARSPWNDRLSDGPAGMGRAGPPMVGGNQRSSASGSRDGTAHGIHASPNPQAAQLGARKIGQDTTSRAAPGCRSSAPRRTRRRRSGSCQSRGLTTSVGGTPSSLPQAKVCDAGADLGAPAAPLEEGLPHLERRASSSGRPGSSCRPPVPGRPRTDRPTRPRSSSTPRSAPLRVASSSSVPMASGRCRGPPPVSTIGQSVEPAAHLEPGRQRRGVARAARPRAAPSRLR